MKIVINDFYGGFSLNQKAIERLKELKNQPDFDFHTLERNDPFLVQVVEEMGSESNGEFSELSVVEIQDGLSYWISEYDGLESLVPYIPVTTDELKNGLSAEKIELLKYCKLLKLQ